MRTNIEINDDLMRAAMEASGSTTKKQAVEAGLTMLVKSQKRMQEQAAALRALRGIDKDGTMYYEDYVQEIRSRREPR